MPSLNDKELVAALFLLKDYLERERRLGERGITMEKLYDAVTDAQKTGADLRRQLDLIIREQINQGLRLEKQSGKLRELRQFVRTAMGGEEPGEDTGSFRVEEVKRATELAELRRKVEESERDQAALEKAKQENVQWWQRRAVAWVAGIVAVILTSVLSGCLNYGMWYLTHAK